MTINYHFTVNFCQLQSLIFGNFLPQVPEGAPELIGMASEIDENRSCSVYKDAYDIFVGDLKHLNMDATGSMCPTDAPYFDITRRCVHAKTKSCSSTFEITDKIANIFCAKCSFNEGFHSTN